MARFSDSTVNIMTIWEEIKKDISPEASLENCAQKFIDSLTHEFNESIVLARLFATIPYNDLPDKNIDFVNNLAKSMNITSLLDDQTPVLSLIGTRGVEEAWNDRRNSQGHIGIPLVSADFIDSIPMISGLLKEWGINVTSLVNKDDPEVQMQSSGKMAGLFYVYNAQTAVDQKERKIIAAQDFVNKYNVKTVFSLGGIYLGKVLFVAIFFTNESIEQKHITKFRPLVNYFKSATLKKVLDGNFFNQ